VTCAPGRGRSCETPLSPALAVSKLRAVTALFGLGVSAADVLAIGDAENDFDLLDACGWSACPENALTRVKARVDWILPGADGEGVRRAIDEQILENNLPPPRTGRHQIYLG
jgi:hydroxymethylpyrimidine pyrophosphatase-like HAD family hydrolase